MRARVAATRASVATNIRTDHLSAALLNRRSTSIGDHDKIAVLKLALQGNKWVSDASINEGDTATFKIVLTTQPFQIDGVVLTDVLPTGVTWSVSGADAVGFCSISPPPQVLTCDFGTLGGPGIVVTKTIYISGTTSNPSCGLITNTATVVVAASEGETLLANNVSTATISVNCGKRMTGGGSIFTADGTRVTHGFELHCNKNDDPNNLEINWGTNPENNFHLESLDFVRCSDDPNIVPNPPGASFDTYYARGTGICNGIAAAIVWTFTDAGEPGTADTATYAITGGCTLNASGLLTFGNHQAHK
jgi:uncharacterized repeat protein (TIGR01451 family)